MTDILVFLLLTLCHSQWEHDLICLNLKKKRKKGHFNRCCSKEMVLTLKTLNYWSFFSVFISTCNVASCIKRVLICVIAGYNRDQLSTFVSWLPWVTVAVELDGEHWLWRF